jgi:hypothetical protein
MLFENSWAAQQALTMNGVQAFEFMQMIVRTKSDACPIMKGQKGMKKGTKSEPIVSKAMKSSATLPPWRLKPSVRDC